MNKTVQKDVNVEVRTAMLSKNPSRIARNEFRKKVKWAIKQMYANHEECDLAVSLWELKKSA